MSQLLVEKYSIRLYGNCSVGVKEGVVKTALDFVPATTVLGAAASAYLLYACDGSASCYTCNAQCPLRQVWDALKRGELAVSHFIPASQQGGDPLKDHFLYWFQLGRRAPRKSVHAHVAINRTVKSVQQMLNVGSGSGVELRGLLYGDEVWAPPSNEFYGFLVTSSKVVFDAAQEVMSFLDLAQLGSRSKYCFVEVRGRERFVSVDAFLEELKKSWSKGALLTAAGGLAFTLDEAQQSLLQACSVKLRVVDIKQMMQQAHIGGQYVSLYKLLLGNVEKIYVSTSDALPVLRGDSYLPEWSLTGVPGLKFSPLGWNRLVPLSWVRRYVQAR
ncbi:MAG: hypothetical protein LM590_05640 [Thermofilum sp.]|nr:hypothetical protein [Thermofilum sp.]